MVADSLAHQEQVRRLKVRPTSEGDVIYNGGHGGGAIYLVVGQLVLNGNISADGGNADVNPGSGDSLGNACAGGGSGGSVLIRALEVFGTGLVSARGGDESCINFPQGGGGAGGRIAVYTFDGNLGSNQSSVGHGKGLGNPQDGTFHTGCRQTESINNEIPSIFFSGISLSRDAFVDHYRPLPVACSTQVSIHIQQHIGVFFQHCFICHWRNTKNGKHSGDCYHDYNYRGSCSRRNPACGCRRRCSILLQASHDACKTVIAGVTSQQCGDGSYFA